MATVGEAQLRIGPELNERLMQQFERVLGARLTVFERTHPVRLRVRADTTTLGGELRRKVGAATARVRATIRTALDSSGLRNDVSTATSAAQRGQRINIPLREQAAGLRSRVTAAAKAAEFGQRIVLPVRVDANTLRNTFIRLASQTAGWFAERFASVMQRGQSEWLGKSLSLTPAAVATIVVLGAGIAQALIAAISAALVITGGLAGVIGAAILGAVASQKVRDAASKVGIEVWGRIKKSAVKNFEQPLLRSIKIVKSAFDRIAPIVDQTFAAIAPMIEPFAKALAQFMVNLAPHVRDFFRNIQPQMKVFFDWLATALPKAIGGILKALSNVSPETIKEFLRMVTLLLEIAKEAIKVFAKPENLKSINMFLQSVIAIIKAYDWLVKNLKVSKLFSVSVGSTPFKDWFNEVKMSFLNDFINPIKRWSAEVARSFRDDFLVPIKNWFVGVGRSFKDDFVDKIRSGWNALWGNLRMRWETFKNNIGPAFGTLKNTAVTAFNTVRSTVGRVWSNTWSGARERWEGFKTRIGDGWRTLRTTAGNVFNNISSTVRSIWNRTWTTVRDRYQTFRENVSGGFRTLRSTAATVFGNLSSRVRSIWNTLWTTARERFGTFRGNVSDGFRVLRTTAANVFSNLSTRVRSIWNNLWNVVRERWNTLRSNVSSSFRGFRNTAGSVFGGLSSAVRDIWNRLWSGVRSRWELFKSNVISSFNKFRTSVTGIFRAVSSAVGRAWRTIGNLIRKPVLFVLGTVYQQGLRKAWNKLPFVDPLPSVQDEYNVLASARFSRGGKVRGRGTTTSDTIPALVSKGEWVVNAAAASTFGDQNMRRINAGLPPQLATGGSINELIAYARKSGAPVRVTSSYRPGDPGWHGKRKAVDFGGFNQNKLAQHFMGIGKNLLELIHTTNSRFYGVKNGKAVGRGYYGGQVPLHRNHLHAAASSGFSGKSGGFLSGVLGSLFDAGSAIAKLVGRFLPKIAETKNKFPGFFGESISKMLGGLLKQLGASGGGEGGLVGGSGSVMKQALAQAQHMGASKKVLLALFMAGFVESGFRNLNYGDRDSLGFLQQRPSQGWGTPAQIRNVPFATRSFVSRAMRLERSRPGIGAGSLAQAVQVSAFPGRYEAMRSRAIAALRRLGVNFDMGGVLPTGSTPVQNLSGQPEAVLTSQQWAAVMSLAHDAGGDRPPFEIENKLYLDGKQLDIHTDARIKEHDRELVRVATARRRR
jgi:phage-related protein